MVCVLMGGQGCGSGDGNRIRVGMAGSESRASRFQCTACYVATCKLTRLEAGGATNVLGAAIEEEERRRERDSKRKGMGS